MDLLPRAPSERVLVLGVVGLAVAVVAAFSIPPPEIDIARVAFWIVVTLIASAQPVYLPRGVNVSVNSAPLIAALFDVALPRPFAPLVIAVIGTLQLRDLRRELPFYGTLYNRGTFALSVFAAWLAILATGGGTMGTDPLILLPQLVAAGVAYSLVNQIVASAAASIRTHTAFARVWTASLRQVWTGLIALVPMGWLMAEVAVKVGLWAGGLFMVPLLLARYSFSKYAETRDLFFGTVSALSQAIDAKDGFTRGHADRVSRIAGAVAREIGLGETEIERIELAALLHDIGKIGVEDRILMKPSRLEPDETELMRRHPIYGASILEPAAALRPLVPIVVAHHEHYDGSGYPKGLKGEEIPLGARILLVSDAYEAMTSDRIYRKAMGHDRALEQLKKYKGMQFDPKVVRALDLLLQKRGPAAFEVSDLPFIEYETLAQLRQRLAEARALAEASGAG